MKGPEHYAEAQRLLSDASFSHGITREPCTRDGRSMTRDQHAALIARAQVHATLAAAAAQALPTVIKFMGDSPLVTEWGRMTGWIVAAEIVDDEDVKHCGKHTGNASNRCLLAEGHNGSCDDDPAVF